MWLSKAGEGSNKFARTRRTLSLMRVIRCNIFWHGISISPQTRHGKGHVSVSFIRAGQEKAAAKVGVLWWALAR